MACTKYRILQLSPVQYRAVFGARLVHSTASKHTFLPAASAADEQHLRSHDEFPEDKRSHKTAPPLSILPFSAIIRTYIITTMSSSPVLLNGTMALIMRLLDAKTPLTDPDRNPILRYLVKKTFYSQFCVGENKAEVRRNVDQLRALGYEGVILESALEVLGGAKGGIPSADSEITKKQIETWRTGMIDTVEVANPGDYIGLKWSGLGSLALHLLQNNLPPTPLMRSAIDELAMIAHKKGVRLLPSAEEEKTNVGIDAWSLDLQRKYNITPGKATVFCTYQAYLKSTPAKLASHLAIAKREGFTAGVKLVRGAYLASEPRSSIWSTIERTHETYDGLAEACLRREWNEVLRQDPSDTDPSFPAISVFLATHNARSVSRAMAIRNAQAIANQPRPDLAYGQLFGMADEVSTKILAVRREALDGNTSIDFPLAFKCVCWGTTGQCLNYLLRRAAENKDAVLRTGETRRAMGTEILRRVKAMFGLA